VAEGEDLFDIERVTEDNPQGLPGHFQGEHVPQCVAVAPKEVELIGSEPEDLPDGRAPRAGGRLHHLLHRDRVDEGLHVSRDYASPENCRGWGLNLVSRAGAIGGQVGELGVPVSIDVHERVSVVTGGYVPFTYFINKTFDDRGLVPLLIRMGVEIKANENVAPWFFFDLGPGIWFGSGTSDATFAWRIGAGATFWGVLGKNKGTSDSASTASSEPPGEPIE